MNRASEVLRRESDLVDAQADAVNRWTEQRTRWINRLDHHRQSQLARVGDLRQQFLRLAERAGGDDQVGRQLRKLQSDLDQVYESLTASAENPS